MKKYKHIMSLFLSLVLIISMSFNSNAMIYKTYGRGSMITREVYDTIINTLRSHADSASSGILYDTGIVLSDSDYLQTYEILSRFCLGEKYYAVMQNNYGRQNLSVASYSIDSYMTNLKCNAGGSYTSVRSIYTGFLPGTNGAAIMAEHDAAYAILVDAVANSPDGDYEFYNYAFNFVRRSGQYDHSKEFRSHSVYSLLCEGKGVCESFASAFQMMCFIKGKECLYIRTDNHAYNVVPVNGSYYVADCTKYSELIPASQRVTDFVTSPFFEE